VGEGKEFGAKGTELSVSATESALNLKSERKVTAQKHNGKRNTAKRTRDRTGAEKGSPTRQLSNKKERDP